MPGMDAQIGGIGYDFHGMYDSKSKAIQEAAKLKNEGWKSRIVVVEGWNADSSVFDPSYLFNLKKYMVYKTVTE